jgi:hypothetical protein
MKRGFQFEYLLAILLPLAFYFGVRFVSELVEYPWKSVPCVIKSGFIEPNPEKTASKLPHRANVIFSCENPNQGTYMWRDFATLPEAQAFLDRYPPGQEVTGYKSKGNETLIRKPIYSLGVYLIPMAALGFVAIKILNQVSRAKKEMIAQLDAYDEKKKQTRQISRNVQKFDQSSAIQLEDRSQTEEWKEMFGSDANLSGLKPRRAQLMQFFGMLVLFVILVSITLWASFSAYKTWKAGQEAGCALAAAPFLAFGSVRVLFGLIRQLLGLVNPRPQVQLSSVSVWPGGSIDLSWRYEGKVGGAKKLLFILVGREYTHTEERHKGRTRHTSKLAATSKVSIHEATQAFEIRDGRARIRIPEGLMHTFHFGFTKIEWILRVEVKIAGWADVHEEYPIIIQPAPLRS